jgi:hypothetical protein
MVSFVTQCGHRRTIWLQYWIASVFVTPRICQNALERWYALCALVMAKLVRDDLSKRTAWWINTWIGWIPPFRNRQASRQRGDFEKNNLSIIFEKNDWQNSLHRWNGIRTTKLLIIKRKVRKFYVVYLRREKRPVVIWHRQTKSLPWFRRESSLDFSDLATFAQPIKTIRRLLFPLTFVWWNRN